MFELQNVLINAVIFARRDILRCKSCRAIYKWLLIPGLFQLAPHGCFQSCTGRIKICFPVRMYISLCRKYCLIVYLPLPFPVVVILYDFDSCFTQWKGFITNNIFEIYNTGLNSLGLSIFEICYLIRQIVIV